MAVKYADVDGGVEGLVQTMKMSGAPRGQDDRGRDTIDSERVRKNLEDVTTLTERWWFYKWEGGGGKGRRISYQGNRGYFGRTKIDGDIIIELVYESWTYNYYKRFRHGLVRLKKEGERYETRTKRRTPREGVWQWTQTENEASS